MHIGYFFTNASTICNSYEFVQDKLFLATFENNSKNIYHILEFTVESRKQVELILKCQVLELGLYLRL